MKDVVIVLDDDTTNSRLSQYSKAKEGPDVFTLTSEEEVENRRHPKDYPSSPRQIEIVPDSSLHYSKLSDEVCASFHEDTACTENEEISETIESIDGASKLLTGCKRKLDINPDEDSSIFFGEVNGSHQKRAHLACYSLTASGPNTVNDPHKVVETRTGKSQKREGADPLENILDKFPISSPTTDRFHPRTLRDQASLFVQDSDDSIIRRARSAESQGQHLEQSLCASPRNSKDVPDDLINIPLLPLIQKNKQSLQSVPKDAAQFRTSLISNERGQSSQEPLANSDGKAKLLKLKINKLLEDSEDGYRSTSPGSTINIPLSTAFNSAQVEDNVVSSHKILMEDRQQYQQTSNLMPYIVHGRFYSDSESQALIARWLKRDKRAFKESNQIPRNNEKARSSINVNLPEKLYAQLKSACKADLEGSIAPASILSTGDDPLPRVRFLRNCQSEYDFSHDVYYPCDSAMIEESINLLYYDARDFFEQYRHDKEYLFRELRAIVKTGKYLIIVLSNLNKLEKSLNALENRIFQDKIQSQLTGSQARIGGAAGKTKMLEDLNMRKFDIEQRIRLIDRLWGVKIHTVASHAEFTESLPNLVSVVGKQRTDPAIRFMRYSHINGRSGKDKTDVLRQALHQITRMPELKANSVISAYPTFQALFGDFGKGELKSGLDGKHLMTEAMEDRLYKLFTCDNPNESIH